MRHQFFGRRADQPPDRAADGHAGDRDRRRAAVDVPLLRRRSLGLHDAADRPHHVLDQLRRRGGALAADRLRPQPRGGGARPRRDAFTTFRKVTLPLLAPGILAAALLAFALSIDDFVISNFNSGTTVTFPLYIFGAAQRGIPVQVNVLATMLFAGHRRRDGWSDLAAAPRRADGGGAPRAGGETTRPWPGRARRRLAPRCAAPARCRTRSMPRESPLTTRSHARELSLGTDALVKSCVRIGCVGIAQYKELPRGRLYPEGPAAAAVAAALRRGLRHGRGQQHLLPPRLSGSGRGVGGAYAARVPVLVQGEPLPDATSSVSPGSSPAPAASTSRSSHCAGRASSAPPCGSSRTTSAATTSASSAGCATSRAAATRSSSGTRAGSPTRSTRSSATTTPRS